MRRLGKIGVYGPRTRALQRKLTFEAFGLSFKSARVYKYLGSKADFRGDVIPNPDINDIQTVIFNEVPDRAYDSEYVEVPIGMERFQETQMDYSRFGILSPMTEEHTFRMHIDDYQTIGRTLIVGDVFSVPFYKKENSFHPLWTDSTQMWEVTDVNQKQEIEEYTITFSATPLSASRATNDLPVDGTNNDALNEIMGQFDDQVSDDVKTLGVGYDEPTQEDPIDYRYDTQENFLDKY